MLDIVLDKKLKSMGIHIIKHVELPQRNGGVVNLYTATIDGKNQIIILSGMDKNNELTTMILKGNNNNDNNNDKEGDNHERI